MSAAPPKNAMPNVTPPTQHATHISRKCRTKCPTFPEIPSVVHVS